MALDLLIIVSLYCGEGKNWIACGNNFYWEYAGKIGRGGWGLMHDYALLALRHIL